jgi:hypothetical protein
MPQQWFILRTMVIKHAKQTTVRRQENIASPKANGQRWKRELKLANSI